MFLTTPKPNGVLHLHTLCCSNSHSFRQTNGSRLRPSLF